MKVKKGPKTAHVMAGNVVPPIVAPQMDGDVSRKAAGNNPNSNLLRDPPEGNSDRLQKCFESLDLFAMNLSEFSKTSLVQHDIKLDNPTPFKEHYCRIPPHQYN